MRDPGSIGALLLDMDGVLADTEPLQAGAWVLLLARYGIGMEPSAFDRWIGIANIETARDVAARWSLSMTPEELIAEREPVYLDLVAQRLAAFPGVADRLDDLGHLPMAVATSASRAEATYVLRAIGMEGRFAGVVTADDVSRTKPHPEPYLRAASVVDREPGACVVIEDSPAGVASAREAGCRVMAVTTTHPAERLTGAQEIHDGTVAALRALARSISGGAAARARGRRRGGP